LINAIPEIAAGFSIARWQKKEKTERDEFAVCCCN
jgi:hypothetical protein